jgi:uncharacterized protein YndB with AHSA1/START domain
MTTTPEVMQVLTMERDLAHPPAKVWRALSEGPLLEQWMGMKTDFQPVVGHKFTFQGEPKPHWDGIIPCEVLAVEPPNKLSFRWYGWAVTLTLTPSDKGTHLRMEQGDFGPNDAPAYAGAKYGWTGFLSGLENLLAQM